MVQRTPKCLKLTYLNSVGAVAQSLEGTVLHRPCRIVRNLFHLSHAWKRVVRFHFLQRHAVVADVGDAGLEADVDAGVCGDSAWLRSVDDGRQPQEAGALHRIIF